jgi:hypothetical protein
MMNRTTDDGTRYRKFQVIGAGYSTPAPTYSSLEPMRGREMYSVEPAYHMNRYPVASTPSSPIGALAPVDAVDAYEPAELAILRDQYNAVRMRARELTMMRAPNPEVVEARAEATKLYSAL